MEPPYVPDLCTIMVDVHFVPGQTVEQILADVRRALDPVAARVPGLSYAIEIPPPARFKGRRRLVMEPLDVPVDAPIVQAVARSYRAVTGQEPRAIGTVLPHSYSADDTCHLGRIPACLRAGDDSRQRLGGRRLRARKRDGARDLRARRHRARRLPARAGRARHDRDAERRLRVNAPPARATRGGGAPARPGPDRRRG